MKFAILPLIIRLLFINTTSFTNNTFSSFVCTSNHKLFSGINFIEEDWNSATEKARAENKLIFIDIYATWCGPCKSLKKNTFSNSKVGEFFNQNFVNITIDGEKEIGKYLAKHYGIQGYPTLIITDTSGKPLLYTMGYINAEELLKFGGQALKRK